MCFLIHLHEKASHKGIKKMTMNLWKAGENDLVSDGAVYGVVFLLSLVCLLLSVIFQSDWPVVAPFLKEMGFAGIISLIVIFTVERFSRKRHEIAADALVEKINHNLFHAIYNRYIPDAVFVEVEKCLMNSRVFRTGHELNYTIDNFEENPQGVDCTKHVKCLAQSRYTLHNVTGGEIEHPITLTLERPIEPRWDINA